MSDFKRIVRFHPAYDKRDSNPSKNYGIHGMNIYMVLVGEKGAISFTIFTGWYLPHVREELLDKPVLDRYDKKRFLPTGADIGIHSRVPFDYEGYHNENCDWLDGDECWYDGSGLAAEALMDRFISEGEDAVWETLEEWYNDNL